jgi:carboxyl-terminal processing protease
LTDASYWRPSNRNIHRAANDTESDEWGVTPDTAEPISDEQHYATFQIRSLRANSVIKERNAVLSAFIRRLPDEVKAIRETEESATENEKTEPPEPFVLRGNAPHYDPQLDKAIERLNTQ